MQERDLSGHTTGSEKICRTEGGIIMNIQIPIEVQQFFGTLGLEVMADQYTHQMTENPEAGERVISSEPYVWLQISQAPKPGWTLQDMANRQSIGMRIYKRKPGKLSAIRIRGMTQMDIT